MNIENKDALSFLSDIDDNSVDLILTDPPYITSRKSGMDTHYKKIQENKEKQIEFIKTEDEYQIFKRTLKKPQNELDSDKGKGWSKDNYLKYGSILGKKYAVRTDYGKWDSEFEMNTLDQIVKQFYIKLRKGGTCIIWFDVWKISHLKEILEKYTFKQFRIIEWIKTNPQPLNSKVNYLTNCKEIAIVCVKGTKPTFNSKYDNGLYNYPIASGKNKFHPTQKNIDLFEVLVKKHSNKGDLVVDTFLGGGTTAIACKRIDRNFKGCEINKEYVDKVNEIIQSL